MKELVSFYGPGLYGRKTANGTTLREDTLGVAHKKLPFGTLATFEYNGGTVTVPVIDRGPYVGGRVWDLTEAAAKKLPGFISAGVAWMEVRTNTTRAAIATTKDLPASGNTGASGQALGASWGLSWPDLGYLATAVGGSWLLYRRNARAGLGLLGLILAGSVVANWKTLENNLTGR